jgi:hypothetical protein
VGQSTRGLMWCTKCSWVLDSINDDGATSMARSIGCLEI